MNQSDIVLLDSNIPMYAAGAEHLYRQPCQWILQQARTGALRAVTDVEVHQEILHRYLSIGLPLKAREVSEDFEVIVPSVLQLTLDEIRTARRLSVAYPQLPARDLLHVALMINRGIASIVSADRHFDSVREIRRLDPSALAQTHR